MGTLTREATGRFRRHVRQLWESRGGGFYGFVAVLTFLYLEALDLAGDVAGLGGIRIDVGWVIGFLVENLVDAVMNGVRSAIWPLAWLERFGIGLRSAAFLAAAYLAYRLVRPLVLRLLSEPDPVAVPRSPPKP
jgi:hypothetical protein